MKSKYLAFAVLAISPMSYASSDFKTIKGQIPIIRTLETIPAYGGMLDAAIYNQGASVKFITTSKADKSDVESDPINIKLGDRFMDIYLNDASSYPECDYAGVASFTIRRGRYIPETRTANWFINHVCKAPD